jgi:hypothetical protein
MGSPGCRAEAFGVSVDRSTRDGAAFLYFKHKPVLSFTAWTLDRRERDRAIGWETGSPLPGARAGRVGMDSWR